MTDRGTILVIGSDGQLGRSLHRLVRGESSPIGFPSDARWVFSARKPSDGFVPDRILDITSAGDVDAAVTEISPDIIINCAAYTDVEKAETDESAAYAVNVEAVAALAVAAKRQGALLIHYSTDYVFDGLGGSGKLPEGQSAGLRPYTETDVPSPLSVYGNTKLFGEMKIEESGCDSLIIRTSALFSEYGRNFVKTMLKLTAERDSVKVVYDQIVSPTYAGDLAAFTLRLVGHCLSGKYEAKGFRVLNYTDEGRCSWFELASEVAELSGQGRCKLLPCSSYEYPSVVRRPHCSVLDKSLVKTIFCIDIPDWHDALARCLRNICATGSSSK